MVTPELEETLKKSRAERSAVLQAMQYFYDHNHKTISDDRHGGQININCRLSWLTALPVGQGEIDTSALRWLTPRCRCIGWNCGIVICS
jgi:hypothetical protein